LGLVLTEKVMRAIYKMLRTLYVVSVFRYCLKVFEPEKAGEDTASQNNFILIN